MFRPSRLQPEIKRQLKPEIFRIRKAKNSLFRPEIKRQLKHIQVYQLPYVTRGYGHARNQKIVETTRRLASTGLSSWTWPEIKRQLKLVQCHLEHRSNDIVPPEIKRQLKHVRRQCPSLIYSTIARNQKIVETVPWRVARNSLRAAEPEIKRQLKQTTRHVPAAIAPGQKSKDS